MQFILQTALKLGLAYSLVPLALFLSYRILNIADLTTDGSFVLGMAVSVAFAAAGHPFIGLIMAIIAGVCAGFVTAFLQTRLGVPSILAGIVTNTGLYTINLMVMGWSSNLSILKQATLFTILKDSGIVGKHYEMFAGIIMAIVCMLFLMWFLSTRIGLSIRATGDNREMVSASSINPFFTINLGLMIANGLTALSGAFVGQMQKSADINAGTGVVTIGLACLIIGEMLIKPKGSVNKGIIAAITGSLVYRLLYAIILKTKIFPVECLKLVTALIVALAIGAPVIKEYLSLSGRRRRNQHA
ncbi:MAG: ABC transporter permease [Erysipelotrichaceae bacterium]|nr:ABC transporter permease [Erysipelotrichaceae bacterium]